MRTRATLLDLAPRENLHSDNHLVLTLIGEDNDSQRPKVGIVPVVAGLAGRLAGLLRSAGRA